MKVEDTIATIDEIADEFDTLHFDEMSKESEVLVEDIKKTIKEGGFLGSSVDMKKLREFDAKVRKLGRRADASKRVGTLYKEAQALIAADPFITQAEKQRLMRDTQTMLADTDLLANLDIQEINGALNEKITGAYDDLLLFKSFVPTGKTRKSYKKYDKNNIDYTSIEAEMNNLLEGTLNPNTGKVDIDFNAQGQVAFEQAVTQIEQTTGRTVDRDQLKRRFISSESNILGMDEVNKTAIIDYQEKARRATEAYKASLKGKEVSKKGLFADLSAAYIMNPELFAEVGAGNQIKKLIDATGITFNYGTDDDGRKYVQINRSKSGEDWDVPQAQEGQEVPRFYLDTPEDVRAVKARIQTGVKISGADETQLDDNEGTMATYNALKNYKLSDVGIGGADMPYDKARMAGLMGLNSLNPIVGGWLEDFTPSSTASGATTQSNTDTGGAPKSDKLTADNFDYVEADLDVYATQVKEGKKVGVRQINDFLLKHADRFPKTLKNLYSKNMNQIFLEEYNAATGGSAEGSKDTQNEDPLGLFN